NVGGMAVKDWGISVPNLARVVHDDDLSIILGGLKLPQGNVNSNTTLTLSLKFVQHPSILK
ncbi:hypothetical protein CFOL_v3_05598, partial [Cephalotus follicularis]